MTGYRITAESILKARELAIGDRVIAHWSEAEAQDQEGTVIGVQIERNGSTNYTVLLDGDLSATDGFIHDISGQDAGSIRLHRRYGEGK